MKDIQRTINTATNPVKSAMDGVKDATRDMTSSLTDLDPGTPAEVKPLVRFTKVMPPAVTTSAAAAWAGPEPSSKRA